MKIYTLFISLILIIASLSITVYADISMDAPNEIVSGSTNHIQIHINEPSIEKYTKKIKIDCSNCYANFKSKLKDEYGDINYSGQKTIDLYVSGSYKDQEEFEKFNLAELKLTFMIDIDKYKKDHPNQNFIQSQGAVLSKKMYIVKSKVALTFPNVPSNDKFTFDKYEGYAYENSDPEYNEYKIKLNGPITGTVKRRDIIENLRSYKIGLKQTSCVEPQNEVNKNCDNYLCSRVIFLNEIKTGDVGKDTTITKETLMGFPGYAKFSARVMDIQEVKIDTPDKHNVAVIYATYDYSVYDKSNKINYFGTLFKHENVKEGEQDKFISNTKSEFKKIINSYKLEKASSAPKTFQQVYDYKLETREKPTEAKLDCTMNSQCSENNVCNACGKCVKDAIDPASVDTQVKLENKLSSKSIYNSVREQMLITTKIIPTFTYNGKNIDYCDIAAPGIKKELVAEMKNPNPYAGFLLRGDLINEKRTKTQKAIIDFSEKPLEHHFLISPNDKKKEIGSLGEVTENIEIKIDGLTTTNEKLVLKPIDFFMDIKSGGVQLQENSNKLMSITPKDKYAKHIYFKASLIGPGKLQIGKAPFREVYAISKPDKLIKLMYYSPKMGNFDIGKELASLSMVNLQKDAAKQIVEDAVLSYSGDVFQNIENIHDAEKATKFSKAGVSAVRGFLKRNPEKYNPVKVAEYIKKFNSAEKNSKKLDLIAKSFKLYSGTYGLTQIPGGTVSLRDDMKEAISNGKNKDVYDRKTWTESVAEYGVTGIDIAQTGLSILTFIPSKIPVVSKLNAGFKTAFSAMTNIWKANLLYIAKDQKIGRAEEHLYPIMIVITAEDESGWQLTQGFMLEVAYDEI